MSVLHLFFIKSNSLWGLPTTIDRKLWVNIISMQAGGNSVHKYSIMITDVQKTNFPTTAGGKGTEKQQHFQSLVCSLMNWIYIL